jgi:caffeoyl-CoA O-methyltransferase
MPPSPRAVTPVGILADKLTRLRDRTEHDGQADRELLSELRAASALAAGLEPYVSRCTTPESPALAALSRRTRSHDWQPGDGANLEQEMLSGHVAGQALKFLVGMTGARRVLELGMFTGYSALAIAEALPDDGRVLSCELDAEVAAFAQHSFDATPAGAKIEIRVGPALLTLQQLASAGETYDFVFIDADKGGYRDYLDVVLGRGLLALNGVICVDNTLLQGEPYLPGTPSANGRAIAAFNEALARDARVEQVLLPLRDGMTLIRRI